MNLEVSEWCGIDGKSIKGTVKNYDNSYQNFVSIVSVFASRRGLVLSMDKLENKHDREITIVQNMIEVLDIRGSIFSLDSLHCQKKTCKLIIESGNDYVIAVKDNQPTLHNHIKRVAIEYFQSVVMSKLKRQGIDLQHAQ